MLVVWALLMLWIDHHCNNNNACGILQLLRSIIMVANHH
jgi:hypothetical protein